MFLSPIQHFFVLSLNTCSIFFASINSFVKKVKMGKRVEKAMKEKLAASSTSQDAEDDANKTPGQWDINKDDHQQFH